VRHHLVDCVDPRNDFTMADYVRAAERAIFEVDGQGRVPLVVGGTGLYLRGLLRGVIEAPARDPQLRDRLHRIVERGGAGRLHAWLRRRDPDSAGRIAPTDVQRLVRAVELARAGGVTWGERLKAQGTWDSRRERYRSLKIGLAMDRETLNARLDARVDRFFEAGLVREVQRLLDRGVPPEANAFKAIGYREVLAALKHGEDPGSVREEVQRNTRRFAKRQRTWFRGEPDVIWVDASEGTAAVTTRVLEQWRAGSPANRR